MAIQEASHQGATRTLCAIFGKLEITYASKRHTVKYEGQVSSGVYRVVAADSDIVVVRIKGSGRGTGHLQCLNFDSPDLYWITVGGNREWFRRVPRKRPNKSLERTRGR